MLDQQNELALILNKCFKPMFLQY